MVPYTPPKPRQEWLLELRAQNAIDLEAFQKAINFAGVQTFVHGGRTFMRVDRLQTLPDWGAVFDGGRELVGLFNGIVRVECPYYRGVSLAGIIEVYADGSSSGVVQAEVLVPGLRELEAIQRHVARAATGAESLDLLANSNANVLEALRLFSLDDDPFVNLYKIYEIIDHDVGGLDALVRMSGISKTEIKRFTRTANHPASAGRQARHARNSGHPVTTPMQPGEARELVRELLISWIGHKLAQL